MGKYIDELTRVVTEAMQLVGQGLLLSQKNPIEIIAKDGGNDYFTIADFSAMVSLMRTISSFDREIYLVGEEKGSNLQSALEQKLIPESKIGLVENLIKVYNEVIERQPTNKQKVAYLDPIDGTRIFKSNGTLFSLAFAYQQQGQTRLAIVYQPASQKSYIANDYKRPTVAQGNLEARTLTPSKSMYIGEWHLYFVAPGKIGNEPILEGISPNQMRQRLGQEFCGMDSTRNDIINRFKPGSGSSSLMYAQLAEGFLNAGITLFQESQDVVIPGYLLQRTGCPVLISTCDSETGKSIDGRLLPYDLRQQEFIDPSKRFHMIAASTDRAMSILQDIIFERYKQVKPTKL